MSGRIVQISVSPGGVPKTRVTATRVTLSGLEGDGHRDTWHHGGPERGMGLYAIEAIRALRGEGHTGGYARVLATGSISEGDPVRLLTDAEATGARMPVPK